MYKLLYTVYIRDDNGPGRPRAGPKNPGPQALRAEMGLMILHLKPNSYFHTEQGAWSTEKRRTQNGARIISIHNSTYKRMIIWSNILFPMGKLKFAELSIFIRAPCSVPRAD